MKLLVFEYICGGGLAGQDLPQSLQREGALMLQALLDQLHALPGLDPIVTLDRRLGTTLNTYDAQLIWRDAAQPLADWLLPLLNQVDAFWPIAPESDGILLQLTQLAQQANVQMLCSDSESIACCGDKWSCYRRLQLAGINCVPSVLLSEAVPDWPVKVIKPRDGVGCEGSWIGHQPYLPRFQPAEHFIVQPFCEGDSQSISALFANGRGWLLTINRQIIERTDERFQLVACQVHIPVHNSEPYRGLVETIASAMPGLWGYIGIDLIAGMDGLRVLEINPRLTTSCVAIEEASGISVAEQVLRLANGLSPKWSSSRQLTQTVRLL